MPANELQKFLRALYNLAAEKCGAEFARHIRELSSERERILNSSWKETPPEDFTPSIKQLVFREIDFDTIVLHAARYLDKTKYPRFLYSVSELAIRFGQYTKARRLLSLVSTEYAPEIDTTLKARVFHKLGDIAFYQNDLISAQSTYETAGELYQQAGDVEGQTAIRNALGVVLVEQGKPDKAETIFVQAIQTAREFNCTDLVIRINMNLGNVYHLTGRDEQAMVQYREALTLLEKTGGSELNRSRILYNLGIAFKAQQKYFLALEHYDDSIQMAIQYGDLYQRALSYLGKAEACYWVNDTASAMVLTTSAFQIFSELGDRLSVADVYKVLGLVSAQRKKSALAHAYFENSKRINSEYHNDLNLGETLVAQAGLYKDTGEKQKARSNLSSALKHFESIGAQGKRRDTAAKLAELKG